MYETMLALVIIAALVLAMVLIVLRRMDTESQAKRWRLLYQREFGIKLGDVRIPRRRFGFDRLIIVAHGLTAGQVFRVLDRSLKIWAWDEDIDATLDLEHEQRSSRDGAYAVWVRRRTEADKELKNLSAFNIWGRNLTTMTLLERLLLELSYWSETGGHLDVDNTFTLCTGSKHLNGSVPRVNYKAECHLLYINWNDPATAGLNLRPRQVAT